MNHNFVQISGIVLLGKKKRCFMIKNVTQLNTIEVNN